jgi:hypothetical protein
LRLKRAYHAACAGAALPCLNGPLWGIRRRAIFVEKQPS